MFKRKVGFLINPIAGMGGRVCLKGTDGLVEEAIRRGAEPIAPKRADEFLSELKRLLIFEKIAINIVSCRLNMGEALLKKHAFNAEYVSLPKTTNTSAQDTIESVKEFVKRGVELIVFVGGDGTARDVYMGLREAENVEIPILGVPSGVKVYSGLFAVTPSEAALVLVEYLKGNIDTAEMEIVDVDEDAFRRDELCIKLFACAKAPYMPYHIQGTKQASLASPDEYENQLGIANYIAEIFDKDGTYILGPGTTLKRIAEVLNIPKTTLGVDVYHKGRVYNDVSEKEILKLIEKETNVWIIVSPIGRQGIIFGRGNQQISPNVIRRVGKDRIIVVATYRKLAEIPGGILRVDTQDSSVNQMLRGYMKVIVDYRTWRMCKVE
ncbi:MAG: ATP-NAD kinase family protein [Candidatus Geothermarchaeota archaeon]